MGLSDQERRVKALYGLKALRQDLQKWDEETLKREGYFYYPHDYSKIVAQLIDSSQQLTGMILSTFDRSSGYWLFGSSENGLLGQHADCFYANTSYIGEEDDQETNDYSILSFAQHTSFEKTLVFTAKWWELYSHVPNLLYSIQRYEDDCFSSDFNVEFNRLLALIFDLKPEVKTKDEKVLLNKHALFVEELGYEKKECKELHALWDKYQNMTQIELEDILTKNRKDKYEQRRKSDLDHIAKVAEKTNPVVGLVEKIPVEKPAQKPKAAKKKVKKNGS